MATCPVLLPFIFFDHLITDHFGMRKSGCRLTKFLKFYHSNRNRRGSIVLVQYNLERIHTNNYIVHISFRLLEWIDKWFIHRQSFFMKRKTLNISFKPQDKQILFILFALTANMKPPTPPWGTTLQIWRKRPIKP